MMKKGILSGLFVSALVLGGSASVFAANDNVKINEDGSIDSKATVQVQAGDPTKPTDPVDPNEPDDGKTGQTGNLTIDQVIVFDFGSVKLQSGTNYVPLASAIDPKVKKKEQNIQVTDKRGTGKGWNLQIKQSPLTADVDGESRTLDGAYIEMPTAVVTGAKTNSPSAIAPNADIYDQNASNKGDYAKIMTADEDAGMGTWLGYYNQKIQPENKGYEGNIRLVVPGGLFAGDYNGTVTWALSDSPDASPA